MESGSNVSKDAKQKRIFNFELMIGALGVGIVAMVVAWAIYGSVSTGLQFVVAFIAGLLIAFCLLVAGVLSIELYRTSAWPNRERGKTK